MDTVGSSPPPGPEHPGADPTGTTSASPDLGPSDGPAPGRAGSPPAGSARLFSALALYTLLRIALVAALTAVLAIFMPLIVAMMFAIIIQLPLAWLLFAGPRSRVNDAIARASTRRRAERSRLQAGLSGEPLS